MEQLLKRYFGYDEFRPMQKEIIENVLNKKDSLVIMPTGGGKSLCYQIPALKLNGLTIVISPLISLMKDQVDSLNANGINATYINSSLSFQEIDTIKQDIMFGRSKILYIAPERLSSEEFKMFLRTLNISLIAIDEAHCISEWGHDFRQEYRNLKQLKKNFPNVPIIALTATATENVKQDILKQLSLKNPKIFATSFNRENLKLIIKKKQNSSEEIVKILKQKKDQPAIIYCFSRKDCEKITEKLNYHGLNALPYHAGLNNITRQQNQDLFIKDKVNIIVATIAFGMGIDKPDVRIIIHQTFPKTIEGYYQQIGRAGRDGLPSECILFYSRGDAKKHEFFIKNLPDEKSQREEREKIRQVITYCEQRVCRRKHLLKYFGEEFQKENCNSCDICLNYKTEKENINKILSIFPQKQDKYDNELFEKLRELRRKIANQKNVPPFIIFSDNSLQDMAFKLPASEEEFLEINGVGQQKLNDFGDSFISLIKSHLNEKQNTPERNSKTDYQEKLNQIKKKFPNAYEPWSKEEENLLVKLFNESKKISEISQILKRQPTAIISKLKKQGLIY